MFRLKPALVLAFAAQLLSGCSGNDERAATSADARPAPDAAFLALDRKDQNLVVYDAFWQHLHASYYDPGILSAEQWRTVRADWREEVAGVENTHELYYSFFPRLLKLLPESHVDFFAPGNLIADAPPDSRPVDADIANHLATLVFIHGPGFVSADVRRGSSLRSLVAEVSPNSPAAEAGVPPGARLLRSHAKLDAVTKSVHFEVDFVPLDASAAQRWEIGREPVAANASGPVVHSRFDLRPFRYRQPVEVRRLRGGVQYLRFDGFGDDDFMRPVFEAIDDAGSAGLIVDLRWNGGGDAEQLKKIAGAFLGSGVSLAEVRDRKGTSQLLTAPHRNPYSGAIVVITSPTSASAAEVLAAAVQDRNRGKIIGRSTAGAVLGAQAFALPDGGTVRLPMWDLRRITGARIEGNGVVPDIWILPAIEDVRADRDPVVERALREIVKPARPAS